MTAFDTDARARLGEDAIQLIREFVASDIGAWTPLRAMAADYARNGRGFGELETVLIIAALCDVISEQDSRLRRLERDEEAA